MLYADADILWLRDPAPLLDDPVSWDKPRGLRESNCHQRRDMALRHCPKVLEPPFVNAGIVALHGELMPPEILRSMVQDALPYPLDSSCQQTIIATAEAWLRCFNLNQTYRLLRLRSLTVHLVP